VEDTVEINELTKEIVEVGFTSEELAQRDKDAKDWVAADKVRIEEERTKAVSKSSALAKLATLGLTEDEVYAIMEE
jgi:hypothetical protein